MYYNCFKEDLQNIELDSKNKFVGIFRKKDGNPALLSNYDLIGYCFLQFKDPNTYFIHSLCIDTSQHGRGFCSKLMCYIIWKYGGIEGQRPAYNLELDVRTEPTNPNIGAFKCYHKFGFVFAKPLKCFWGPDGQNCRMHRLIETDANHITIVVYDHRSYYVDIDGVTQLPPIIIPKDATIPYKDYFEWDLL
jgi:Acetyltransferase (GNAT) family